MEMGMDNAEWKMNRMLRNAEVEGSNPFGSTLETSGFEACLFFRLVSDF